MYPVLLFPSVMYLFILQYLKVFFGCCCFYCNSFYMSYLYVDKSYFIPECIAIDPMHILADLSKENSECRRWCVKCCSSIDRPATWTVTNQITVIIWAFYNYGKRPRLSRKVNCIQNIIWHMDFLERMEIEDLEKSWTLPYYMEHIC